MTYPWSPGDVLTASDLNSEFASKGDISTNGTWTSYTPSVSNITVGNGTLTARYVTIGKLVMGRIEFTLGSTSAIGSSPQIGLPTTAVDNNAVSVTGKLTDAGSLIYGQASDGGGGGTTVRLRYLEDSADGVTSRPVDATSPFTWTDGDFFQIQFSYEEA